MPLEMRDLDRVEKRQREGRSRGRGGLPTATRP